MSDEKFFNAMQAASDCQSKINAGEKVTICDVLLAMGREILPPDDPELLFVEWIKQNAGKLGQAVQELGIEVEDGPDYMRRLKAAAMPVLKQRHEESR